MGGASNKNSSSKDKQVKQNDEKEKEKQKVSSNTQKSSSSQNKTSQTSTNKSNSVSPQNEQPGKTSNEKKGNNLQNSSNSSSPNKQSSSSRKASSEGSVTERMSSEENKSDDSKKLKQNQAQKNPILQKPTKDVFKDDISIKEITFCNDSSPLIRDKKNEGISKAYKVCTTNAQARERFPNVLFYAEAFKSNFGKSQTITELLTRKGNFKLLEMDHAYIQWIFPNKYKSMFNYTSKPLSDEEIEIFIVNEDLSKNYIESYKMMLEFYGMRLIDQQTGQLERTKNYKERYDAAICGHNCLRIRRILTSLSNLGFRRYAIQLVNFLSKEIFEGEQPLKKRSTDFIVDWQVYGEYENKRELKNLEKVVQQNQEDFSRVNVILRILDEEQNKQKGNKIINKANNQQSNTQNISAKEQSAIEQIVDETQKEKDDQNNQNQDSKEQTQ